MKSSRVSSNESAKETASGQPSLQTMNDLYSLELSQVLLQAMDAGMIEPEASDDGWIFHVPMRRAHMMVNLPKRLMCIEAESAELPTAA